MISTTFVRGGPIGSKFFRGRHAHLVGGVTSN